MTTLLHRFMKIISLHIHKRTANIRLVLIKQLERNSIFSVECVHYYNFKTFVVKGKRNQISKHLKSSVHM